MAEKNPLEMSLANPLHLQHNKRGRPKISETIEFSPQPKSLIMSEFLEMKNKLNNAKNDELILPFESNHLEEDAIFKKPIKIIRKSQRNEMLLSCNYPDCSYSCKLSCNLIKHKRIHSAEKQYMCDQCCFRTNFINSLKVHKRIHTGEKPYACEHCSYRCNSNSNLKKHYVHRHPEVPKT